MRPLLLILAITLLATPAFAISATTDATCEDGGIRVIVTIASEVPPPGDWVGYIVVRRAVGVCLDEVLLTPDPVPFGENLDILDTPDLTIPYVYRAYAIDEDGERHSFSFGWYESASVNCGDGPMLRGTVEDWGWTVYIHECPDHCWYSGFLEGNYPIWLHDYDGTDAVFAIYGDLYFNFEGPYIVVDEVQFSSCGPVPVTARSWSEIKALYGQ